MSDHAESVNPLLQIDTSFRTYLNAYTRSYQNHIVDGSLVKRLIIVTLT